MGKGVSKLLSKKTPVRILLLGLDSAGKTTILYKMKLGEYVQTMPTIGFNVESVKYKNISFDCWDAGGQEKFRALWVHYSKNAQAIIFVVDSSDHERVDEAKEELHGLLEEVDTSNVTLLVYANKQDIPNAVPTEQLRKRLGLEDLEGVNWHIEGAVATTGTGLHEGLDWLVENLPDEHESKKKVK